MALSLTVLLVVAGLVIDFGLVRVDRQVDKSAADSATLAGLHALNGGDGNPHPFMGVCTAVRYLQQNNDRFAGINENVGWTNGDGVATASGCTDSSLRNRTCIPGDTSSWARFSWTDPDPAAKLSVTIQSGYDLTSSTWNEDSLPASQADEDDSAQGCDQLTVVVAQAREPGFGSLATSSDLQTAVRSVGRVEAGPGGYAPALLLLERHDCPVLGTGSSSADTSWIHVFGDESSDHFTQPGTIHSDSDGNGDCTGGSNEQIFWGRQSNGIVAYAAPMANTVPAQADASKPGSITSVAGANGKPTNYIYDGSSNVYASGALNPSGAAAASKSTPTGRTQIGRLPVDQRYRETARNAMLGATSVFAAGSSGYVTFPAAVDQCKPTQAQVDALRDPDGSVLDPTSRVWIKCLDNNGFNPAANLTIPAGTIVFAGTVAPGGVLALPNAHHVYVIGIAGRSAINLNGSGQFTMNTAGNMSGSTCGPGQSADKAVLFIKQGSFKEANGSNVVRMCRTTVFLMSGQADGCVPGTDGTAPAPDASASPAIPGPCGGGLGSGQFTQNGGAIDWTAPDTMDLTTDSNGDAFPAALTAWGDVNGPEDLALWTESASGNSADTSFSMTGGGVFNVRGVFMAPNAAPFGIGGGAYLNLTDAQFIARTIQLNGSGTKIDMRVDPNAAVTLPKLDVVGLVR